MTPSTPPVIGLAGGIACGKSTVTRFFEALGAHITDADIIAREVVEPGTEALGKIQHHFGDSILQANGQLDRAQLRQHIFDQPEARHWLNQLLHPIIRQNIEKRLAQHSPTYHLMVSPLLFETDQARLCQRVCLVDIPQQLQLERLLERGDSDKAQALKIIQSQMSRQDKLAQADDIIDNSAPLKQVKARVEQLHQEYLSQNI